MRVLFSMYTHNRGGHLGRYLELYSTVTVVIGGKAVHQVQVVACHASLRPYVKKGKGCPYSITQHRVPEPIPVLGSQPAGDVSHKPGGRLPLLSARHAVTPQPLRVLLPVLLLGEQMHNWCEQFA